MSEEKIAVIACAGMDKALGSVARASVFRVVEELRPNEVELVCLPPLLAGITSHSELVKNLPVVVVDGCAERCATKIIAKNGGRIRGRVLIPSSARKHGLTPGSASDIGPEGEKLVEVIAEEVASIIDKLIGG